jgi:uncharacterized membrane protein YfcA
MGLFRYGRMGLLPSQWTLLSVGVPMGIESLVGAAAGGAFAGSTSAEVLKFLFGLVLIAAALGALLAAAMKLQMYKTSDSTTHTTFLMILSI